MKKYIAIILFCCSLSFQTQTGDLTTEDVYQATAAYSFIAGFLGNILDSRLNAITIPTTTAVSYLIQEHGLNRSEKFVAESSLLRAIAENNQKPLYKKETQIAISTLFYCLGSVAGFTIRKTVAGLINACKSEKKA